MVSIYRDDTLVSHRFAVAEEKARAEGNQHAVEYRNTSRLLHVLPVLYEAI